MERGGRGGQDANISRNKIHSCIPAFSLQEKKRSHDLGIKANEDKAEMERLQSELERQKVCVLGLGFRKPVELACYRLPSSPCQPAPPPI